MVQTFDYLSCCQTIQRHWLVFGWHFWQGIPERPYDLVAVDVDVKLINSHAENYKRTNNLLQTHLNHLSFGNIQ